MNHKVVYICSTMEKLVVELPPESICIKEAYCPNGHSLMDPSHPMGNCPSIKVYAIPEGGAEGGEIFLNAWYGNFEVDSTIPMKDGDVFEIYCPECKIDLRPLDEKCSFCGARIFRLNLPRGGIVEACSRKGCHNHKLKVIDLSAQLARIFDFDTRPRY